MFNIQTIQSALQTIPEMHGWIFTNFSHRDTLTDSLLSLDTDSISTRRWVYVVPTEGEAYKIVHSIESGMLDSLPGNKLVYSGRSELLNILNNFSNKTYAVLSDENISVISTVDSGFVKTLHDCNIKTLSAASLIQITKGLLSAQGIESHERAATCLYMIIEHTWNFICSKYTSNVPISEYDVLEFILNKFKEFSLVYDHEPIVAFGKNAGDPHYSVSKTGSAIAQKGDIIQLDIFAKEADLGDEQKAIFADISWVGVFDTEVKDVYKEAFSRLCESRDIVYTTLLEYANTSKLHSVSGCDLDEQVRKILIHYGYTDVIKHRTGHGIDTACHGSGVNLDSVEFPDKRKLLNGSCFSVEPGIYFGEFGMRTEIDIYIENGFPVISGKRDNKTTTLQVPQMELLIIS